MQIYSVFSIPFLLYSLFFVLVVFVSFYLPGAIVLSKNKLTPAIHVLLSIVLGMVLWGMQGYILGYAHLRIVTYVYLLAVLVIAYKRNLLHFLYYKDLFIWVKNHKKISLLILLGVIIQLLPIINSGLRYADGVRFFGVNAYDGVMHLSYIQSIVHNFPPVEPGAFDHPMTNYHYWSDMLMADLVRIWRLPTIHLYFQFFPIFISFLTALASFQVVKKLGFSKNAGLWCFFFLFFAGDGTYALILAFHGQLNFITPAIDNGANQFLNMPNAIARPLFLSSIITLSYWIQERKKLWGIITVLLFAGLVGIKVYYGMFVIFGMALLVAFLFFRSWFKANDQSTFLRRLANPFIKEKQYLLFFIVLCVIAAAIYLPPNEASGGLKWFPLEWPKIFLGAGGLNWGDWWLRHQVYEAAGNTRNLLILDGVAVIIALICIHGTRLLGLFAGKNVYKKLGWEIAVFFIPGLILFHFIGLYTLQDSGGFNVFNFFVVGTVILSILSSALLDQLTLSKKHILQSVLVVLLVILTVPRVVYQASSSFASIINPTHDSTLISNDELNGLNYINTHTPLTAIVQSHPKDPYDSNTPYVSFFTDRLTYLTGSALQLTHNQPIKARQKELTALFDAKDSPSFFGLAEQKGIDILYLKKNSDQRLLFNPDPNLIEKLYENKSIIVYRINSH